MLCCAGKKQPNACHAYSNSVLSPKRALFLLIFLASRQERECKLASRTSSDVQLRVSKDAVVCTTNASTAFKRSSFVFLPFLTRSSAAWPLAAARHPPIRANQNSHSAPHAHPSPPKVYLF